MESLTKGMDVERCADAHLARDAAWSLLASEDRTVCG